MFRLRWGVGVTRLDALTIGRAHSIGDIDRMMTLAMSAYHPVRRAPKTAAFSKRLAFIDVLMGLKLGHKAGPKALAKQKRQAYADEARRIRACEGVIDGQRRELRALGR